MYGWTHRIYGTLVMLLTIMFGLPAAPSHYFMTHHWLLATIYFYLITAPPVPVRYYGSEFMIPSLVSFISTLPDLDRKFGKHRGWFHSIWGYLLVSGIFAALYYSICVYLFGAHPSEGFVIHSLLFGLNISLPFLVHLVLDSLTYEGVVWVPPFDATEISGPFISGQDDSWFFFPAWAVSSFLIAKMWWDYLNTQYPMLIGATFSGVTIVFTYLLCYLYFGP